MTQGSEELAGSGFVGTDTNPVFFTEAAIAAVKDALCKDAEPGDSLRVSIKGGGCSGYKYNLDFDKEPRIGDLEMDLGGARVLIDPVSAGYLKGTTVDFVSGLNGSGFKFSNPNAKRTCGCGSSFG